MTENYEQSLMKIASESMTIGEQLNASKQTLESLTNLVHRISLMARGQEHVGDLYSQLDSVINKILTDGETSTSAPVAVCVQKVTMFNFHPFL